MGKEPQYKQDVIKINIQMENQSWNEWKFQIY